MSVLPLSQRRGTSFPGRSPSSPLPRQPANNSQATAAIDRIVVMKQLYLELATAHESERRLLQRVEETLQHTPPQMGQAACAGSPQPSASVDAKVVWGERRSSESRSVGSSVWSDQRLRCNGVSETPFRTASKGPEPQLERSLDDVAIVGMSIPSHSSTVSPSPKVAAEKVQSASNESRTRLEDKVRSLEHLANVLVSQQEAIQREIRTLREEVVLQRKVSAPAANSKVPLSRTPHRSSKAGVTDDILLHESTQKLLREAERQLQFEDASVMDTTRGTIDGETPPRDLF